MSFPNVSDVITTCAEARSGTIADNVSSSNALLYRLKEKGKVRPVSGGRLIYEEIAFAENGNAGWYSGYDTLSVGAQDVITAAEFSWKQAACPVVVSGLELMENSGKEQLIDLVAARLEVAENTLKNLIGEGLYSDGTGTGSKQLTGLAAAVPTNASTGTYGGIDRSVAANAFWRSITGTGTSGTEDKTTIMQSIEEVRCQLVRGAEHPDLAPCDNTVWKFVMGALQGLQQFTNPKLAEAGFQNLRYAGMDIVLDGGVGGDCTASTMFMLNTNFLFLRPHAKRNFVPLNPDARAPVNQDAIVKVIGWMGNLTCSGAKFQGRLTVT